jgi:hypothetical protein
MQIFEFLYRRDWITTGGSASFYQLGRIDRFVTVSKQ